MMFGIAETEIARLHAKLLSAQMHLQMVSRFTNLTPAQRRDVNRWARSADLVDEGGANVFQS